MHPVIERIQEAVRERELGSPELIEFSYEAEDADLKVNVYESTYSDEVVSYIEIFDGDVRYHFINQLEDEELTSVADFINVRHGRFRL